MELGCTVSGVYYKLYNGPILGFTLRLRLGGKRGGAMWPEVSILR